MKSIFTIALCVMLVMSAPASGLAQDADTRRALAEQMIELTPPRPMVATAARDIASRMPQQNQVPVFEGLMRQFNFERMEAAMVDAMAEVFTEAELRRMVDYHSSPEMQAINEKMPVYQAMIEPMMKRLMDEAFMRARTGAASDVAPPQ